MEPENLIKPRNPRPRAILWGFPRGKTVDGEWLDWVCGFMDETQHVTSMPKTAGHAGRIDIARSYLIELGKMNKKFDELMTFDTDVVLHNKRCTGGCEHELMSLDRVQEIIDEDFELGFDVVHGPTMNKWGQPTFGYSHPERWLSIRADRCFPVDWCTGAFLVFSRKAIDHIGPISEITNQDGSRVKLYCRMLEKVTEDADLCANLARCGLTVGADPRLLVGHRKDWDQYVDPKWWVQVQENVVRQLAERSDRLAKELMKP